MDNSNQQPTSPQVQIDQPISSSNQSKKILIVCDMFGDDDHYIFATNKNLYLVKKIARSQNQTVKDTTDKIFTNLQFITNER